MPGVTRAEVKKWKSLGRRKGRQATGLFLVEGRRMVADAIRSEVQVVVVLHDNPLGARNESSRAHIENQKIIEQAGRAGLRIEAVPAALIDAISDTKTPQSLVAIGRIPMWGWDDVTPGPVVLLDGVQDPGNVGTLIRTAIGLGASALVGLGPCADPWSPKVLRASAGASFFKPVFRSTIPGAVAELSARGTAIWAATPGASPPAAGKPSSPVALALGSEAHGVSAPLLQAAEHSVGLPLAGGVESLNVAVAGAILLDRLLNRL